MSLSFCLVNITKPVSRFRYFDDIILGDYGEGCFVFLPESVARVLEKRGYGMVLHTKFEGELL